ncbi:hypothetical protein VSH64_16240 [Amycolatopsis rhabdoformis]|uniref:Membrane-anchored protein n=1 Tax=Amycolatopsis rhabdoformis TaxID=1448059 RepID=A0ABZ1IH98_9PSEU|nr:hypothetical protein [Amycolatopsis rhabdoformis]WSE33637.1 hypothetical protein VSH64_16240 [Amycolatopsis rhabdoformis]
MTTAKLAESGHRGAAKVPEITVVFWVIKVLTTGVGETTSDFLAHTIDPVIAAGLAAVALAGSLVVQLRARAYSPVRYWVTVLLVSVFGTMAADVAHVALGVPYAVSTAVFALALAAVFLMWHRLEGTLSIHDIRTPRREVFYWLTVGVTFALGTAAGDLTATTLGLGYLGSGVVFAVVIAVPPLAWRFARLDAVAAFWAAYVLTRPLGASFADWLGVGPERGGLGLGTGPVSLALLLVIAVLVGCLAAVREKAR